MTSATQFNNVQADRTDLHSASVNDTDTQTESNEPHPEKRDVEAAPGPKPSPGGWGSDAPDGGTWAWLCVLGAFCTSICSFGWLNSASL